MPVDAGMAELVSALARETQVATHTRLNIDYVPGMVSVLHGRDLLAQGIRTVYDALALVPGVELSRAQDGMPQVIVRGIGKTYSSGKIKVLLNGIAFNMTLQGSTLPLMLPIELVQRIEMIRGPGSAIYGEFASVGVVNIITREDHTRLFAARSNQQRQAAGGQYHWVASQGEVTLSLADDYSHGGQVNSGPDRLQSVPSLAPLSESPGLVNTAERRSYIGFSGRQADYRLQGHWLRYAVGDFFGVANALSGSNDQLLRDLNNLAVQVERDFSPRQDSRFYYAVGYQRAGLNSEQHQLFPPGFPTQNNGRFDTGVFGAPFYQEDKYTTNAKYIYTGVKDHQLLTGAEYSQLRQGETYAIRNYKFENGILLPQPNARYSGADNWLSEGRRRELTAWYLQDQYELTEKLSVITGLRFDYYNDIGGDMTPRLATVYQVSNHRTVKLQFAQSFRPPTFLEMYSKNNAVVVGNPDLKSERLNSVEMAYTYNDSLVSGRLSTYFQHFTDLIMVDNAGSGAVHYANAEEITARGIELEFQRKINYIARWDLAFSFVDADSRSGEDLPGVANFLINAGILYSPVTNWDLSLHYRLISDRPRERDDPRAALNGYQVVDISLSRYPLLVSGLRFRLSVFNLFDAAVAFPAGMSTLGASGNSLPAYPGDYPQLGRELSLSVEYLFN